MVLYKDFHFDLQSLLNLINRRHGTQVIYMELRGVGEKLDYEKLFAVYDIKVMKAEVSVKGLKKCRLLTTFLGQNVNKFILLWMSKNSRSCQNGQFVELL